MPPIVASLLVRADGNVISKAPNIEAAIARNKPAMPSTTHGFCSTAPNTLPVSPAITPSGVNMQAIPSMKAAESLVPSQRLCAWRAPNALTVTATMGYTHGVRLTARPPSTAAPAAYSGPLASARVNRSGSAVVACATDVSARTKGMLARPIETWGRIVSSVGGNSLAVCRVLEGVLGASARQSSPLHARFVQAPQQGASLLEFALESHLQRDPSTCGAFDERPQARMRFIEIAEVIGELAQHELAVPLTTRRVVERVA